MRAILAGVDGNEYGAAQEDVRRIIGPQQNENQRAGSAVEPDKLALAELHDDHHAADHIQQGRDQGAHPHVCPGHLPLRHPFIDQRKQQGQHQIGHDGAGDAEHWSRLTAGADQRLSPDREYCAGDEGHEQHEGDSQEP